MNKETQEGKRIIIREIFKDIEKAIEKTQSNKPVFMRDSKFLKELKKIKEKFLKEDDGKIL